MGGVPQIRTLRSQSERKVEGLKAKKRNAGVARTSAEQNGMGYQEAVQTGNEQSHLARPDMDTKVVEGRAKGGANRILNRNEWVEMRCWSGETLRNLMKSEL